MINLKEKSGAWSLNLRNVIKGAIYAVATSLFTEISLWSANLEFAEINYKRLLIVAISGLCGYLLIKLPQNKDGNIK